MKHIGGFFHATKKYQHRHASTATGRADYILLFCVFLLAVFGLLMVYDSSVAIAIRDFGNPYYYVVEQMKWLILGFVALLVVSRIHYHTWLRLSVPMLVTTLVLLVAVFLPGIGIGALGARRWLNFGFFVLQPAELTKLVLVLYLSAWFSTTEKGRLPAFLLLLGAVAGLVILEPDLGTTIIIVGISVCMYFFSGAPLKHFAAMVPVLISGVIGLIVAAPYRYARLMTFLNPDSDPQGASYQIKQILIALGSGGWFGVGIGKSKQKFEYLPEANTDSIFAIIGEELGFIGSVLIISLFVFILWRGFRIAKYAPDIEGKLMALGITVWFGIQTCVNLGAMVALVPLTGVPLPLISYGGSSLIIILSAFAILLNISKHMVKRER